MDKDGETRDDKTLLSLSLSTITPLSVSLSLALFSMLVFSFSCVFLMTCELFKVVSH